MSSSKYAAYKGAEPYFKIVREALGDLVDGDHFFDIVTEHTIYEVLYELGWPRIIHGRIELMHAFRGYTDIISLQSADHLAVHTADSGPCHRDRVRGSWNRFGDGQTVRQPVLFYPSA